MHDLWNFSPPPAVSSSESESDDGPSAAPARASASGPASRSGAPVPVVVLGDSPVGKDKSGVGTGTLHQGVGELLDEDELDLLGTPSGKKRKTAPKKKKAKNRADRAKVRTMLSKNAATIATLRYGNNQESVDAMVKRMKSTAAQEEEERRKKAEALKPREVIDDEDDIILPSSPPPSTANNPTAAGAGEAEKIVIKVSEPPPSSGKHEFRISKTDKIGKVIQKMGEILGSEKTFVLMFDGEKLTPDMTPEGLDMEDDDMIEVYYTKQ